MKTLIATAMLMLLPIVKEAKSAERKDPGVGIPWIAAQCTGGWVFIVGSTKSMEPSLKAGDSIVVVKTTMDTVSVGDIIVYETEDKRAIVHRVVEKNKKGLVVRGDNNPQPDPIPVTQSRLIGKVSAVFFR